MDLTPRSTYTASSPHRRSAFRHAAAINACSPYPTPPQSRAQTEAMSAQSSTVSGLGIMNCSAQSPSGQLAVCTSSQSLLSGAQAWHRSPVHNFANLSPNIDAFSGMPFYEDLDTTASSASSPFVLPTSEPHAATQLGFLNTSQPRRNPGTILQQRYPAYDNNFHYRPVAATPTRQPRRDRMNVENSWGGPPTQMFQSQQVDCSTPQALNHTAGDMMLDLEQNVERPGAVNKPQRVALRTSNSNVSVAPNPAVSTSGVRASGIRKSTTRRSTAAKYVCETCGQHFTRNSNCKSHMKIHDPNRKYPHKCTAPQCTKKFSRKTDLVRHVDSVHKKLKKFACDQCGHKFARQDTLRRHCEDGCRRQLRQSQRAAENDSFPPESIETYPQSSAAPFRSSPPVYRDTNIPQQQHQQQPQHHQLQASFIPRSSFLDNTAHMFPQFSC